MYSARVLTNTGAVIMCVPAAALLIPQTAHTAPMQALARRSFTQFTREPGTALAAQNEAALSRLGERMASERAGHTGAVRETEYESRASRVGRVVREIIARIPK
ncbi:hypothetical protein H2203_004867 [Taxawa tesnikishii (nom. ined.)]|nr:hypothetical protein H2203_004867 [Dothideales sp. JES 119]